MPQPPLDHDLGVKLAELLASPSPDEGALSDLDYKFVTLIDDDYMEKPSSLAPEVRRYIAANYLELEVNNGGFGQFFGNKGPVPVADALAFVQERGLKTLTTLLQNAIAALPGGKLPKTYDAMEQLFADTDEDLEETLSELDDTFYDSDEVGGLLLNRLRYALEHKAVFFRASDMPDKPKPTRTKKAAPAKPAPKAKNPEPADYRVPAELRRPVEKALRAGDDFADEVTEFEDLVIELVDKEVEALGDDADPVRQEFVLLYALDQMAIQQGVGETLKVVPQLVPLMIQTARKHTWTTLADALASGLALLPADLDTDDTNAVRAALKPHRRALIPLDEAAMTASEDLVRAAKRQLVLKQPEKFFRS